MSIVAVIHPEPGVATTLDEVVSPELRAGFAGLSGTVLALGAYLKNQPCLVQAGRVWLGGVVGDLGHPDACTRLGQVVKALITQAGGRIDAVAHDLHPDFHSTRLALELADRLAVPAIAVQHHHAHVAAVLAENGWQGEALGLALDGVGLGTDGTIWGGELLRVAGGGAAGVDGVDGFHGRSDRDGDNGDESPRCNPGERGGSNGQDDVGLAGPGFERLGHLRALPLPGGDRAATEPWRMAAAALDLLGRGDEIAARFPAQAAAGQMVALLRRSHLCPSSTALGRWFDAAAGLLGLCEVMRFEAEAAIALEQAASDSFGCGTSPVASEPGWRMEGCFRAPASIGADDIRRATAETGESEASVSSEGAVTLVAPMGSVSPAGPVVLDLMPVMAELADERDARRGAARFHAVLVDGLTHWVLAAARATGLDRVALSGGCFHNRILSQGLVARLRAAGLQVMTARRLSPGDAGLSVGQARVALARLAGADEMMPRADRPERILEES